MKELLIRAQSDRPSFQGRSAETILAVQLFLLGETPLWNIPYRHMLVVDVPAESNAPRYEFPPTLAPPANHRDSSIGACIRDRHASPTAFPQVVPHEGVLTVDCTSARLIGASQSSPPNAGV